MTTSTLQSRMRSMYDAYRMWSFLRKFRVIERRYDNTAPLSIDPEIYKPETEERKMVEAHNRSILMSGMLMRTSAFTPIPRLHLMEELSTDRSIKSMKKTQETIAMCINEGFLVPVEEEGRIPEVMLTVEGSQFGGWFLLNAFLLNHVARKFDKFLYYLMAFILGLSPWILEKIIRIFHNVPWYH